MPSFREKIAQRIHHVEPAEKVPWHLHDKRKCYAFCESVGAPTAKVFQMKRRAGELDLAKLPPRFVVKPTTGHSMRGVMMLTREGLNGRFLDVLRQRHIDTAAVVREQDAFLEQSPFKESYRVMAEEFLLPEGGGHTAPADYKLYTFGGQVGLIIGKDINRRPHEYAWFDGDWNALSPDDVINWDRARFAIEWAVRPGIVRDTPAGPRLGEGDATAPQCAERMIELATMISNELATPFCRVDLFATDRGAVVGEITLAPGNVEANCFSDEWDAMLGAMWEGEG